MTARKKNNQITEPATVVYCGPTIPGVAKHYTIYKDGIPATLEATKEEKPALGRLIVQLEELPEAMKQLREKKGPIFTLYKEVQKNK